MGFCSERFDHLVDAEELLASQGLVVPGPEINNKREILYEWVDDVVLVVRILKFEPLCVVPFTG